MKTLDSIQEIKDFFKQNNTPIYYISPTGFNLLGIEKWVSNFKFITYKDPFDEQYAPFFSPKEVKPKEQFQSIEETTNYLLTHPEVIEHIKANGKPRNNGKVLFLMFDEKTEMLAKDLDLEMYLPSAQLRKRLDSKIDMSMIAERAEVPCVPNVLSKVNSYNHLKPISSIFGTDLVIQTPYGNSGQTTFFISNEEDYEKYSSIIESEKVVKIMKRLNCRTAAVEGCVTKHGTIVSSVFSELIGHEQLTPYQGGWCGNELYPDDFSKEVTDQIRTYAKNYGGQLSKEGYRGYFELDFLLDKEDNNEIYLGELNPRLTTISNLTNNSDVANIGVPLFLFHLLEWMDVPFEIDIEALNKKWSIENAGEGWSMLNIKHTLDSIEKATDAPPSGIWKIKTDMNLAYEYFDTNRDKVTDENEAFFFNNIARDDDVYEGVDLGILFLKGKVTSTNLELTKRAVKWTNAMCSQYRSEEKRFF